MNSPFTVAGTLSYEVFNIGNRYVYHIYCDTQGINAARWFTSQDMVLKVMTVNTMLVGEAGDSCFVGLAMTFPNRTIRRYLNHTDYYVDRWVTKRKTENLEMPVPANTQVDFYLEQAAFVNSFIILTVEYMDFQGKSDLNAKPCGVLPRILGVCE